MKENHFNCIYLYTNKINGKKYVGQAMNFNKRHKSHINQAYNEKCREYNYYFHKAIRKHGIENFEIEILKENLQNQEELNHWECYYIQKFNTLAKNQKGYNIASGGSNGNSFAGKTKEEMKEISKKMSNAKKGHEVSEETRQKMSKSGKGKHNHEGENNPMYGKSYTEERRKKTKKTWNNKAEEEKKERSRKISKANKGKNNGMAKKVAQINPTTKEVIKIWDYAKEISIELGCSYKTIRNYLNGKYKGKPYKGYVWEYYEGD